MQALAFLGRDDPVALDIRSVVGSGAARPAPPTPAAGRRGLAGLFVLRGQVVSGRRSVPPDRRRRLPFRPEQPHNSGARPGAAIRANTWGLLAAPRFADLRELPLATSAPVEHESAGAGPDLGAGWMADGTGVLRPVEPQPLLPTTIGARPGGRGGGVE